MFKSYKTLVFLLLIITAVIATNSGLQLIHADKNIGKKEYGEQLHIFTGNVHFRQDTINMYCNDAVFFDEQDRLEFVGNVLFEDGHRTIKSDKIEYYPEDRLAICLGNVRIKGPTDSLYADYLTYNFKTKNATAEENIYIYDQKNDVQIWGEFGQYESEQNHSLVKINARLSKVDSSSGDTLTITANQLEYYSKEEERALAIDSVVIIQGALKAVCDTAIYFPKKEIVWLNHNPLAWYEDSELSGINMKVEFDSLVINNIFVFGNAKAKSLADSASEKYNMLNGRNLEFQIEDKKPRKIIAIDNASSVYYLKQDSVDQGTNYATADTILVHFENGELDSINIIGGSEGVFYPVDYKGEKAFAE